MFILKVDQRSQQVTMAVIMIFIVIPLKRDDKKNDDADYGTASPKVTGPG